jgi:hypothetical protein
MRWHKGHKRPLWTCTSNSLLEKLSKLRPKILSAAKDACKSWVLPDKENMELKVQESIVKAIAANVPGVKLEVQDTDAVIVNHNGEECLVQLPSYLYKYMDGNTIEETDLILDTICS